MTEAPRCPRCDHALEQALVKSAIWRDDLLAIVEDIPALICRNCPEQYYDDAVSEALRRLSESGFPAREASGERVVRVFSLEGRVVRPAEDVLSEESY